MKWRQKRNRDGELVPDCWVTDKGRTVARVRVRQGYADDSV